MIINKLTGLFDYYNDIQKESTAKIKLAQQKVAKIVLNDPIVKNSYKFATEIDESTSVTAELTKTHKTSKIEAKIRKLFSTVFQ